MKKLLILLLIPYHIFSQSFSKQEIDRWVKQAQQVTIIRDHWGIPHVYGKTDADAVFGLLYAQCEDDFKRVEMNYIEKLGRMAEVKGESELYNDLLIRLIIDSAAAVRDYTNAPAWLKKLCNAFADGINYYLYKNPNTKPALLNRFKPWYPFLWTDGSIGAINTAEITVNDVKDFYSADPSVTKTEVVEWEKESTGSNGFAFSPRITESGNAILYINPHVTFYFRPEVHMISEEGLNVYGAVTWGQFFIYQGFNEHCGWMHTSSAVDAADSYIEKVSKDGNRWTYEYEGKRIPVIQKRIPVKAKKGSGIETTIINTFFTHHGPVMAKKNGQWISVKADNRIMNGLIQCWQRTKAKSFEEFKKTLELKGNISNNTVYADAEGNIAYWHGNRIPKRDPKYDWSKPVDGSISATEWRGYHNIRETVFSINPVNGWLQNCNSTPFTVAGSNSPKKENYPRYMAPDGENFRGVNAVRVLSEESKYTLDKVIKAGYDRRLAAFEVLVPALIRSFEQHVSNADTLYNKLYDAINILRNWDFRSDENSVATTIAIEWGQKVLPAIFRTRIIDDEEADQIERSKYFVVNTPPNELIQPLSMVIDELMIKFGSWKIAWGEINRFQRISSDIENKFDDNMPSIPVGFAASTWGMLPSYVSRAFPGTKKRYGYNGNSFVCAVEFGRKDSFGGKKIKARSLLTGGVSGDPNSKHFSDQALMYSKGEFKDVLFYKEDVMKHVEKKYHPGE